MTNILRRSISSMPRLANEVINVILGADQKLSKVRAARLAAADGKARRVRRTATKGGQAYSVSLGEEAMNSIDRVTISYTYKTLVPVDDHLLRLRVDQPTRGLSIECDFTTTEIERLTVLEFMAGTKPARLLRNPKSVPEKVVIIDFDGWAMPRSGAAIVW